MIPSKDFFETLWHEEAKLIDKINIVPFFQKILFWGKFEAH